jgi:hypothetical protein
MTDMIFVSTLSFLIIAFLLRMVVSNYRNNLQEKRVARALKALFEMNSKSSDFINQEMTSIFLSDMTIISSKDEFPVDISGARLIQSDENEFKISAENLFMIVKTSLSSSDKDINQIIEELKENKIIK